MPNYVTNRVVLIGSDENIKKVVEFVKGENGAFDFDKIVPKPESINKYDTTNYPNGEHLKVGQPIGFEKGAPIVTEELIEEYKQATREQQEKYGVVGWYDWSCKYWGTKWNAVSPELYAPGFFTFDTAWSAPIPVLIALSKLFPEVEIDFVYADEDSGCNTGEGTIQNGDINAYYPADNSEDAWKLYFETHEWAQDEMHKNEDGDWVWND